MRFLTKEWYCLMQLWGLGDIFKKIPDKEYSDADISKLYEKALKKENAAEKKAYNTPPELWIPESLNDEDFDPMDYLIVDEENENNFHVPASAEEVRASIIYNYEKECEAFEKRGKFDPSETIDWFKESYKAGLNNAKYFYPKWMQEETDIRLMALHLLPETVYLKFKNHIREAKKEWNRLNRCYEKASKKQDISEDIRDLFDLHDACLLSLRKQGKNYVMEFQKDGMWSDDELRYRRITFKKAQILEKDSGISTRKQYDEHGIWTSTTLLYHELYNSQTGYEVHLMFWAGDDLAYVTLDCSEISGRDYNVNVRCL